MAGFCYSLMKQLIFINQAADIWLPAYLDDLCVALARRVHYERVLSQFYDVSR